MRGLAAAFAIDLALAFAIAFVVLMLCGFAWAATHDPGQAADGAMRREGPGPLAETIATIAAMGAAAAGLLLWRRRPSAAEWQASLAAARRPSTWGWSLLAAAGITLVLAAIGGGAAALGLQAEPSNDAIVRALLRQSPLLLWVFAVALAPVYEEVLFRRVLFGRFEQAGLPRTGLAVSAALFACAHEIPGAGAAPWAVGLVAWLAYATMGAVLALVYRRCGTLWAAILTHALHNALGLLLL